MSPPARLSPPAAPILYAFEPDGTGGAYLDRRVREGLADSLAHLFATLGETLEADPVQAQRTVAAIRARTVAPRLVALYSDLVEAVYAEDVDRARALTDAILHEPASSEVLQVATLSEEDLGQGQVERFIRYGFEGDLQTTFAPVDPELRRRICGQIDDVMTVLDRAAPGVAGEMRALVRQVVLAGRPAAGSFGGASSFYLWGAMLLNADRLADRMQIAMAMVHETAHTFLFGVTMGAPLTENTNEEFCTSPLRTDPRPVEGVFHASFVLARMIYALDRLRASGLLTAEEAAWADVEAEKRCVEFAEGLSAMAPIARLTPEGSQLLNGARRYVTALHPSTDLGAASKRGAAP